MTLDKIEPDVLIHGACPTGADEMASQWGCQYVGEVPMAANWKVYGRGAGPRRNEKMLSVLKSLRDCGYECLVVAFPKGESKGTRHMMGIAEDAGFEVIDRGV